jgi:hypothetical protein
LAKLLKVDKFKASEGWLSNFKERHGIVFKQPQGEAGDIDLEAVDDWRQTILRNKLANFSEDDVFNVDETGLFWKLLPSKTLTFKGELLDFLQPFFSTIFRRSLHDWQAKQRANHRLSRKQHERNGESAIVGHWKVSKASLFQECDHSRRVQGQQKGVDDR